METISILLSGVIKIMNERWLDGLVVAIISSIIASGASTYMTSKLNEERIGFLKEQIVLVRIEMDGLRRQNEKISDKLDRVLLDDRNGR